MRSEQDEVRTFQVVSVTCAHMPVEKPQGDCAELTIKMEEKEFPKKGEQAESSF